MHVGSRDLEGPLDPTFFEKCAHRVPPKPRTLGEAEISCGMVGLDQATHHGGGRGGGGGQAEACLQRGVEGVFNGI